MHMKLNCEKLGKYQVLLFHFISTLNFYGSRLHTCMSDGRILMYMIYAMYNRSQLLTHTRERALEHIFLSSYGFDCEICCDEYDES